MKSKTIYLTIFLGLVAGVLFQSSDFSVQAQPTPSARPYCTQCERFFPNMAAFNAHFCPVHGIGCPGGGGGGGNTYSGPTPEQIAAQQAAAAQRQREEKAAELDKQGVNADNTGDYETAINYYQKALEILPNNTAMQQHLDDAQQALKDQIAANAKQEAERLARAQEKEMQFQKNKAKTLNEMKGISFDSGGGAGLQGLDDVSVRTGTGATPNDSGGLKTLSDVNTDTRVVDARSVPSGLPKGVEDTLNKLFHDSPPESFDRIRKGWQAVMTKDWKVADACFQDALKHDPGNPKLIQMLSNFRQSMKTPVTPISAATNGKEDEALKAFWVPERVGQKLEDDPNWRDNARLNKKNVDWMSKELMQTPVTPISAATNGKEDEALKAFWVPERVGQKLEDDPNWRDNARLNKKNVDWMSKELMQTPASKGQ